MGGAPKWVSELQGDVMMYRRSKAMLLTVLVRRMLEEMLNKKDVILKMSRGMMMNQFLSQQDIRITHASLLTDIQMTVHTP